MGDMILDFRPDLGPDSAQELLDVISEIGEDDHITIVVDRVDAHETDSLIEILDEHGFDYQSRGGHEDEYYIIAKRPH